MPKMESIYTEFEGKIFRLALQRQKTGELPCVLHLTANVNSMCTVDNLDTITPLNR